LCLGVLCWQLLSTLFSEVCSRSAWLQLLDHLFTHFERISHLLTAPVVLLREMKEVLLAADTDRKIMQSVRQQQPFHVDQLLRALRETVAATPEKHFMAVASRYLNGQNFEMDLRKTVMMSKYPLRERHRERDYCCAVQSLSSLSLSLSVR